MVLAWWYLVPFCAQGHEYSDGRVPTCDVEEQTNSYFSDFLASIDASDSKNLGTEFHATESKHCLVSFCLYSFEQS